MTAKELRAELAKLYGAASAFRMLDPNTSTPAAEIQAAKDTGEILRASIHDLMTRLG